MTDTVIKGTGNSRTLRTVPNALTLYPDFTAMITAMINGTFPIDLGGLQDAGLTTHGTDLNKANLLTNATETSIWGNSSNRTVNDAFSKLRSLITTAQSTADTAQSTATSANTNANARAKIEVGSYVGTDSGGGTRQKALSFSLNWKVLIISHMQGSGTTKTGFTIYLRYEDSGYLIGSSNETLPIVSQSNTSVTIRYANNANAAYNYVALGT